MPRFNQLTPAATRLAAIGLTAARVGTAAAADVSDSELRRLVDPTGAELAAEAEGHIGASPSTTA
jgi:hypothetical protein